MNYLGLLSLVLVIAGSVWFLSAGLEKMGMVSSAENETSGVDDLLDSARTAADELGNYVPNGKKIEIYDGIYVPEDSLGLDMSGRNLPGSLKAEIGQIKGLIGLDLSNNNFTNLPAEVGQLSELETLNLSNNPLMTGLPREIGNLTKLQVLNVKGTQYSEEDLAIIRANLPSSTRIIK